MLLLIIFSLFSEIMEQDKKLFEQGFNQCQISVFQELLTDDFEFYHDKSGKSDKEGFIRDTQRFICGSSVKRQHLDSEVYPMYKADTLYAALQEGRHTFSENGIIVGHARFSHLWIKQDGKWKLSRSLSFAHQSIEEHLKLLISAPVWAIGIMKDGEWKGKFYNNSNAESRFNVASLTKPITALAVLKLVDKGEWDLDTPLYTYWTDPDLTQDPRSRILNTRHILSHQSGLPNWREENLAFQFDPGTQYQYSGEGFEYLRRAIEKKFQKKWEIIVEELLFAPLQMTKTSWIASPAVAAYKANGESYLPIKKVSVNAADDLYTTLSDYGKFLKYIVEGAGLSTDLYQDFLKGYVQTKKGKYFALGLEQYLLSDGEKIYAHGGSDEGSKCIFFLHPESNEGLLIFSSSDIGYELYEPIMKIFWGEKGKQIIRLETD
ncbi:serine hydrolase [Leadbetterella byssophila]|uniref:Beta-lactamase n=1 Tax=Leadbetterella byssophila (strain DSM 17132 / JCM 16389 / KACC 11308 / NBRC 106382 / 4M15) TaxID=649349 RepID=E4RTT4_LEAB4|nr:serine hydrolase [Leadbetterella byssophila]ADQ17808.1 beta-lactamase [Leadbetterella byssophila DSM 17132]